MPILIRKIDRIKWEKTEIEDNDYSADSITGCLRTSQNNLSLWKILSEENIIEAVLAIASNGENIDTFDVALLDEDFFIENNIDLCNNKGITPFKKMESNHIDASNLTYNKLGLIAKHVNDKIRDEQCKRYRRKELFDLLRDAVQNKYLNIEDLHERKRDKLLKKFEDLN